MPPRADPEDVDGKDGFGCMPVKPPRIASKGVLIWPPLWPPERLSCDSRWPQVGLASSATASGFHGGRRTRRAQKHLQPDVTQVLFLTGQRRTCFRRCSVCQIKLPAVPLPSIATAWTGLLGLRPDRRWKRFCPRWTLNAFAVVARPIRSGRQCRRRAGRGYSAPV